ncbi:MAG: hypothetical protein ACP5LW_01925 [Nitrososphaeria archaeon]
MDFVVVKLGGSCITYKDKPFTINEDSLRTISSALHDAGMNYFIVHGGGSWGHTAAIMYGLSSFSYSRHAKGVAYTKLKMQELSSAVQKFLIDSGVHTFYFPAQVLDERIKRELEEISATGVYPLTYGDVIYEAGKGFRVIGGDEIIMKLSGFINVVRVVFIMATPGIMDENGRVIERISLRESTGSTYIGDVPIIMGNYSVPFSDVLRKMDSSSPDATGGIAYKLYVSLQLARRGIPAIFVGASDKENIIKALNGSNFTGSIVMPDVY